MHEKIRQVSLDLWGTLIESNPRHKQERAKLVKGFIHNRYGMDLSDQSVRDSIRRIELLLDRSNEITGGQHTQEQALIHVMCECGIECDDISIRDVYDLKIALMELFVQLSPTIIGGEQTILVLEALKSEGLSLNILSNTSFVSGAQLRRLLSKLGIDRYMSFMIFSDELGYSKPSRRAFTEVCTLSRVPAEQILHVGDLERTDGMARQYGMKTLIINKDSGKSINDVLTSLDNDNQQQARTFLEGVPT